MENKFIAGGRQPAIGPADSGQMRQLEVLFALHFLQARQAALVLELQPLPLVDLEHRRLGADHQLDVSLVEFVHQRQEAARGILFQRPHHLHIIQDHAVI